MHSPLFAILCMGHGLHPPGMWNAKIQWNQSVCQSASWIQLRSLGFGPTTPLCVRQSMPDNGFCRTIPAHLSTLPPRTGCKEHPINYRDHTDIIELFSPLPALITSHLLLKTDSPCTVAPSGSTATLQRFCDFYLWLWHTFCQSGARGLSGLKFGSHMATPYPLPPCLNARGKKQQQGSMQRYISIQEIEVTFNLVVGFSSKGHLICFIYKLFGIAGTFPEISYLQEMHTLSETWIQIQVCSPSSHFSKQ